MKKHILFVDDEESLALLGADLLEDFGYEVSVAFNGLQAYDLFSEQPEKFSLVVTDESMPEMTGIELAQKIYALAPETPVILCSGHLLTMQEKGMENTKIIHVLGKTEICTKLTDLLDKLWD